MLLVSPLNQCLGLVLCFSYANASLYYSSEQQSKGQLGAVIPFKDQEYRRGNSYQEKAFQIFLKLLLHDPWLPSPSESLAGIALLVKSVEEIMCPVNIAMLAEVPVER